MRYLIITLMLSACGVPHYYESNSDFDQLKFQFQRETGVKITTPIIYDNLDKETIALCEIFEDNYRVIRVNSFYWEKLGKGGKEETIYHELGHCELNRDHSETLTQTGLYSYRIPNSIMYPYEFGDASYYWIFREHYLEELMFPNKKLEY
jgi:hypothetical protein